MNDREQQLRERAYQLWQDEGEPHGRDREHWEEAQRSLDGGSADQPALTPDETTPADDQPQGSAPAQAEPSAEPQGQAADAVVAAPDAAIAVPASAPAAKATKPRAVRAKAKPTR